MPVPNRAKGFPIMSQPSVASRPTKVTPILHQEQTCRHSAEGDRGAMRSKFVRKTGYHIGDRMKNKAQTTNHEFVKVEIYLHMQSSFIGCILVPALNAQSNSMGCYGDYHR